MIAAEEGMMGVRRRAARAWMWSVMATAWVVGGERLAAAGAADEWRVRQDVSAAPSPRSSEPRGEVGPVRRATHEDGLSAWRAAEPPRIDGRLEEAAWAAAEVADGFVQQAPYPGALASEATEVRVLVDGSSVYVGARLSAHDANVIVARLARRDDAVLSDWFYVYLDSYHDRRTAFAFGVSAAGVQRDVRVADDDREDAGWNAVWESAVTRDDGGWTAELRIPLSQLRFNAADDRTRWGVNFRRDIARHDETAYWAPIPQGGDRFVSLFGELRGLDGITPGHRVEVIPHTVARLTRAPGSTDDPFYRPNETVGSVGANVLVGLGSSLTLSAAINPDFGQVEADPAAVNLTAFETFQQERRPFFVEGSDIFTLSFPFWPPFFYSRRLGRSPQGSSAPDAFHEDRPTATTILGALKLSGKTESGWSIGLLDAVTAAEQARYVDAHGAPGQYVIEPRTNYSVARVAKELRNGATGVGAIVTATHRRLGTNLDFLHGSAYGFGADAFHRFRDGEYTANLSVLGSHVRGSRRAIERTQRAAGHYFQRPDANHVQLDPTRTSLSGMSASGRLQRVQGALKWGIFGVATSPGYEINDLGFNPTLDFVSANAWVRYEDFTPGHVFRSWSLGTMGGLQRGWGGELHELTADLGFLFELNSRWGGGVWAMRHRPAWTTTALRGGPALRRPGRWMGSFSLNSDRRRTLSGRTFVFWTVEDETDGYDLESSANFTLRPSDRFDLRLGPVLRLGHSAWQYVARHQEGRAPLYLMGALDRRTVALSARLSYTFSPRLSLQLYARPFIASGAYTALREVVEPAAVAFAHRFRTYTDQEAAFADGRYAIDRDGDGSTDVSLPDPSFSLASLQMNTVLRWEYRPGSTLFAVWTHDRDRYGQDPWDLGHSLDGLWAAPARNVFQLKISYWIGM